MDDARHQARHCFQFEQDFVGSWRCIPLCVRRKLDLIGLKLKLSHWLELSQVQRQELVDWSDDDASLQTLKHHLQRCTAPMADGEATSITPARSEPWQHLHVVAPDVARAAADRGLDLSPDHWATLDELARFALCKLARPGHDHHNLNAAFAELLNQPTP
jgi:hypothetical protein